MSGKRGQRWKNMSEGAEGGVAVVPFKVSVNQLSC